MFGANDSAVAGGGLLQLRALDWNVDGKLSCSSLTTYIYFFFLRPFQKLSTNHSLPSNRSQKWSSICKHRIYWMDWLYNRSAYKTAIDQLTIPFMYLTHTHPFLSFSPSCTISGFSSQLMAISEIGVSFPDETFGHESRFGIPFTVRQYVYIYIQPSTSLSTSTY